MDASAAAQSRRERQRQRLRGAGHMHAVQSPFQIQLDTHPAPKRRRIDADSSATPSHAGKAATPTARRPRAETSSSPAKRPVGRPRRSRSPARYSAMTPAPRIISQTPVTAGTPATPASSAAPMPPPSRSALRAMETPASVRRGVAAKAGRPREARGGAPADAAASSSRIQPDAAGDEDDDVDVEIIMSRLGGSGTRGPARLPINELDVIKQFLDEKLWRVRKSMAGRVASGTAAEHRLHLLLDAFTEQVSMRMLQLVDQFGQAVALRSTLQATELQQRRLRQELVQVQQARSQLQSSREALDARARELRHRAALDREAKQLQGAVEQGLQTSPTARAPLPRGVRLARLVDALGPNGAYATLRAINRKAAALLDAGE